MNGSFCLPFSKILLYGRDRMTNACVFYRVRGVDFQRLCRFDGYSSISQLTRICKIISLLFFSIAK